MFTVTASRVRRDRHAYRSTTKFIPKFSRPPQAAALLESDAVTRTIAFNRIDNIISLLEFDTARNAANIARRGIGFESFAEMDFENAVIVEDTRKDYGEPRLRVWGLIERRLHVAIITRRGDRIRVISVRRANRREKREYEKERHPS